MSEVSTLYMLFLAYRKNHPEIEYPSLLLNPDGSGCITIDCGTESLFDWDSTEEAIVKFGKLIGDD